MRNITVVNHMTLDGVMQAPARQDEDPRGDFQFGGWAAPNTDPVMGEVLGAGRTTGGSLLFGRRTYEDFFEVWPHRRDNPFTEILNRAHKYVASRKTLSEPLPWINSTLLAGDAADAVGRLKQEPGGDLTILGSGQLIGSLFRRGLIDEFVLMIHPLVLGQGRRLFPDGASASLELINSVTTTKGVVIATYRYVRGSAR